MQLRGKGGYNGWSWIFIIEGCITILLGIGSYWLLVDFPDSKRTVWGFLDNREREWYLRPTSFPMKRPSCLTSILGSAHVLTPIVAMSR
jgi:hypothetical protein